MAVRGFRFPMRDADPMYLTSPPQARAALPTVGMHRAARFHAVADELAQSVCRGSIGELAQANPPHLIPLQFDGDHDQALTLQLSSARAGLRPPRKVASISTSPCRRSRSSRTMAARSFCNSKQAPG